jgi:DNA-binding transcriptional LysR family regulator
MLIDPRRLLTFRAVAQERSFSRAARALALSQPAVSQQVAALERGLGIRLLDREPGGLRLTSAGAVALAHADAVAERLALAQTQLAELAAAERVRLRIGAFPSALAALVPAAVARLHERAPGAEVIAEEGSSEELAERVRGGALHIAVAFQDTELPRREPEGLERHELLREPFLVALAPTHRLAGEESIRLADLAEDDWTAPSPDHLLARTCRAAGFTPRFVSITSGPLAIRALVARGLAVTLVPRLLAAELDGVVARPLAGRAPERDVYALTPPGGRHPLTGALLEVLTEVSHRASAATPATTR